MIKLKKLIGNGAVRACYEHPQNKRLCIKVLLKKGNAEKTFTNEINLYKKLKNTLSPYLCRYEEELVETDKGIGMITELFRDFDNKISKTLAKIKLTSEIKHQIDSFTQTLIENDIFFYDFNLQNFVVQRLKDKTQLKYIDMKSYQHYKPWTYIGLEKFIPYFARRAMKQRINKLNALIKQKADREKQKDKQLKK